MEETEVETTTIATEQPVKKVVRTTREATPDIKTEHPQKVYEKKRVLFRTYQIIWYVLGVIEVLLVFRLILKALGASPFSGFTTLVYALSDPLALPFQGILGTSVTSGKVFEWSTLIAIIVYAIVAAGIVQLLQMFKPTNPHEVSSVVDEE